MGKPSHRCPARNRGWLHWAPWFAALPLLFRLAVAPIPCGPELLILVTVGDYTGYIGFSQTFEHATYEARTCVLIHPGYEGDIIVGCDEGELNATVDGCVPARCPAYASLSVAVGEMATTVMPYETIFHGGLEERLCRELNPLYRGKYFLFCNFGGLSVDISLCLPQYDVMEATPWEPRARQAAVTLGDGAVLLMGGLGQRGPLREVWQWTPIGFWEVAPVPPYRDPLGTWEQPWAVPLPPWSGRYGAAAVWQTRENGEQVTLLGGNDNLNRNDVWRWLRSPSPVAIALDASDPIGSQPEDCTLLAGPTLLCNATTGVSGRRWYISEYLQPSTEVHVELRHSGTGSTVGVAVLAVQIGSCRQEFQVVGGQWSVTGCTGGQPPWARPEAPQPLGGAAPPGPGEWQALRLQINRTAHQLQFSVDGEELLPADLPAAATAGEAGPAEGCSQDDSLGRIEDDPNATSTTTCTASSDRPSLSLPLVTIEVAAWPSAVLEARALAVTAPAGYWELLLDSAPWEARATHAVVALPDGDLLLMGGIGDAGLLNDVWRWSPQRCALLPDMDNAEAARYALECSYDCLPSVPYGQWTRLPSAPWAPRQEHAALWTSVGVLLAGGRTSTGFERDVWLWTSEGAFCSLAWQGKWQQLTPAAAWAPRVGHSLVGFTPPGSAGAETVLLLGGFGGEPETEHVSAEGVEFPMSMRSDLWCGNVALGNFSQWMQLAPYAPFSARTQLSTVVAPTLGSYATLSFGGYDRNARFTSDFWRWAGENATSACKVESD